MTTLSTTFGGYAMREDALVAASSRSLGAAAVAASLAANGASSQEDSGPPGS